MNLRLRGDVLQEIEIKNLALFPRLQALDVPVVGDGREFATVLRRLKELRELHLDFTFTSITPETYEALFESIGTLDCLQTLTLEEPKVFPKVFASIARPPKLTSLFISQSDQKSPGLDDASVSNGNAFT